jgi:hypothetical protein
MKALFLLAFIITGSFSMEQKNTVENRIAQSHEQNFKRQYEDNLKKQNDFQKDIYNDIKNLEKTRLLELQALDTKRLEEFNALREELQNENAMQLVEQKRLQKLKNDDEMLKMEARHKQKIDALIQKIANDSKQKEWQITKNISDLVAKIPTVNIGGVIDAIQGVNISGFVGSIQCLFAWNSPRSLSVELEKKDNASSKNKSEDDASKQEFKDDEEWEVINSSKK